MYGGERGRRCVFLKDFWVVVAYDRLKASHVSIMAEFMWVNINLRVPWFLIQFIITLPYKLLSFMFGPLLFGWSCTELPTFRTKYCMWCLRIIFNYLS